MAPKFNRKFRASTGTQGHSLDLTQSQGWAVASCSGRGDTARPARQGTRMRACSQERVRQRPRPPQQPAKDRRGFRLIKAESLTATVTGASCVCRAGGATGFEGVTCQALTASGLQRHRARSGR